MIEALRRDGTDFLDIRIVRHKSGKRERVLLEIVYYLNCCPFKFGNKLVLIDAQSKTSIVFSVEVPNTEQQVKA